MRLDVAETWTSVYSGCSADRLFAACVRTVTGLNWKIQHTDAAARTLSCAAKGKKKRLGGGQDMSLVVEQATGIAGGARPWKSKGKPEGKTAGAKVVLGWGYQVGRIFDHGEKKEIGGLFFETLDRVLPGVPEPEATPPTSTEGTSAVAELERLADLHARGSLTDEEFAKAKARILGS